MNHLVRYETSTKEFHLLRQAKEQSDATYLCKSEAVVFAFLVFTKSLERSRFSSVLVSTAANRAWLCSAIPNIRLNKGELLAAKKE